MKRLIGLISIVILASNATAQKKDIRVNFGFYNDLRTPRGLAHSKAYDRINQNYGYGIHVFPKWFYSKNISFGLNMEYIQTNEPFYYPDNKRENWMMPYGTLSAVSISPTVNYYLTANKIRPFIGIGVGGYHILYHKPELNVAVRPLVGVAVKNLFELSMEYNQMLSSIQYVSPLVYHTNFSSYYLTMKASFSIGLFNTKRNKETYKNSPK